LNGSLNIGNSASSYQITLNNNNITTDVDGNLYINNNLILDNKNIYDNIYNMIYPNLTETFLLNPNGPFQFTIDWKNVKRISLENVFQQSINVNQAPGTGFIVIYNTCSVYLNVTYDTGEQENIGNSNNGNTTFAMLPNSLDNNGTLDLGYPGFQQYRNNNNYSNFYVFSEPKNIVAISIGFSNNLNSLPSGGLYMVFSLFTDN
jgi:hypothetical protein